MRAVAFLRAINVGGRTVKMDRLRALFAELDLANVETFIASGNVLFDAPKATDRKLEERIEAHLRKALGYDVATFVRNGAELGEIAAHAEAPEDGSLYVGFLRERPSASARQAVAALATDVDDFEVDGRELYWRCRTSIGRSEVSGALLEKALGGPATLRNVTTVRKLAAKTAGA